MTRRSVAITLAQGALMVALSVALSQAVETAPGPSAPTMTPTWPPLPTCSPDRWFESPPAPTQVVPCVYPDLRSPVARTATETAWQAYLPTIAPVMTAGAAWEEAQIAEMRAGQTPTPCPVPPTPVRWANDHQRCYDGFETATETARIASGETYIIHQIDGPDGTPTVWIEGTLPPHARPVFTRRALGLHDDVDAGEDQE